MRSPTCGRKWIGAETVPYPMRLKPLQSSQSISEKPAGAPVRSNGSNGWLAYLLGYSYTEQSGAQFAPNLTVAYQPSKLF